MHISTLVSSSPRAFGAHNSLYDTFLSSFLKCFKNIHLQKHKNSNSKHMAKSQNNHHVLTMCFGISKHNMWF